MSYLPAWRKILAIAFVMLSVSGGVSSQITDVRMLRVGREMLCVTEGALAETAGQRLSVTVAKMRAYVNQRTSQAIEVRFTYLGPTANEARLGSGEMRRQFGLKLRAQDACNLVYAMWRIEPESKLVVSVKTNPGQHTSAECGNRGYRNIKPLRSVAVPLLHPGDSYTLRAEMNGDQLRVFVDRAVVWDGSVGSEARSFDGPVGIRSDNAGLDLQLQVGQLPGVQTSAPMPCKAGETE